MSVSFRIDDVCPEMDWDRFEKFLEMLMEFDVKPLLGVVPHNEDPKLKVAGYKNDFWEKIRELQQRGYVIAMHGYNHVYTTRESGIFPINNRSEFAGLPYAQQLSKIRDGKAALAEHDIHTKIFMAPAHSFDQTTIDALKNNGFKYITDGFARNKYKREDMIFLPICNSIRHIKTLSRSWKNLTVVIHTNNMSDVTVERYRKECKKLGCHQLVSFEQLLVGKPTFDYNNNRDKIMLNYDAMVESAFLQLDGIMAKVKGIFDGRKID